MSTESFWHIISGEQLAQGDCLLNCPVPFFPADFTAGHETKDVPIRRGDLIVVTQSCDLENKKVSLVAMCPILTIARLKEKDKKYAEATRLEEIRKGRFEALHMLGSPARPDDNQDIRIVDFREITAFPSHS